MAPSAGSHPTDDERQPKNDHMETMAGHLVSSLVDEDELPLKQSPSGLHNQRMEANSASFAAAFSGLAPPAPPPQAETTWTYLDPQGQIQGPFQSEEMMEWFTAGYFPADLMVKRSEDATFLSLNDVRKLYGRCPFTPGPQPPPFSDLEERLKQQQMLQMHQQYLMQQHIIQQQQQAQQQQFALQLQHVRPDLNKLLSLGPLRLGGDLIGSYGGVDPLRSLLGSLGAVDPQQQQSDPLKQFLARGGGAPQGLDVRNNQPVRHPVVTHSVSPSFESGGLFGQAQQPDYHHQSVLPASQQQLSEPPTPEPIASDFDPIQSLLQQLHQSSRTASSTESSSPQLVQRSATTSTSQKIHTVPEQQPQSSAAAANHHHEYFTEYSKSSQFEKPSSHVTSIWDRPAAVEPVVSNASSVWNEPSPDRAAEALTASSTPAVGSSEDRSPSPDVDAKLPPSVEPVEEDSAVTETFVTPKLIEKKEKKSKKAEEKRRAKEAKKQSELAGSLPYIPGMPGSVQPDEQVICRILSSVFAVSRECEEGPNIRLLRPFTLKEKNLIFHTFVDL